MKKVLGIVAIALFAFSFASCKKDYECCFYDNGVKLGTAPYSCATVKMSKKEKDDTESAGASTIALCGTACSGWTYECK